MDNSKKTDRLLDKKTKRHICVDNLFPGDMKSGTKGHNMDIETLFSNTSLNTDPEMPFTTEILLERIKKRRVEKLLCYRNMLIYCHKKIVATDEDQGTDLILTMVEIVPECRDYNSRECLEYISSNLREENFDTAILSDTMIFITWKYIELKNQQLKNDNLDNQDNQSE
jgi:hypothetical protein